MAVSQSTQSTNQRSDGSPSQRESLPHDPLLRDKASEKHRQDGFDVDSLDNLDHFDGDDLDGLPYSNGFYGALTLDDVTNNEPASLTAEEITDEELPALTADELDDRVAPEVDAPPLPDDMALMDGLPMVGATPELEQ